ncbi:MAG: septum formation protein Maf [Nanoarchaeota archaeon]|nr:septum formation protein Maf [Nanoarchaeota archaeon]
MVQIILASASERRKELMLRLIGKNFTVLPSGFDEDNTLDMEPEELAMHNSRGKARDVAKQHRSAVVIGVDTLVFSHGKVLGKPVTPGKAKEMLKGISGKNITVISGITVIHDGKEQTDYELTKVKMKDMTEDEINAYVASDEPLDKAGAFGAMDKGALMIESVQGSFYNVVGLPIYKLNLMLKEIGIELMEIPNR